MAIVEVTFIPLDIDYIISAGPLIATIVFIVIAIELDDLVKSAIALGIGSAVLQQPSISSMHLLPLFLSSALQLGWSLSCSFRL